MIGVDLKAKVPSSGKESRMRSFNARAARGKKEKAETRETPGSKEIRSCKVQSSKIAGMSRAMSVESRTRSSDGVGYGGIKTAEGR